MFSCVLIHKEKTRGKQTSRAAVVPKSKSQEPVPSAARLLDGRPDFQSGAGGRLPIRHGSGGFKSKLIHSKSKSRFVFIPIDMKLFKTRGPTGELKTFSYEKKTR